MDNIFIDDITSFTKNLVLDPSHLKHTNESGDSSDESLSDVEFIDDEHKCLYASLSQQEVISHLLTCWCLLLLTKSFYTMNSIRCVTNVSVNVSP